MEHHAEGSPLTTLDPVIPQDSSAVPSAGNGDAPKTLLTRDLFRQRAKEGKANRRFKLVYAPAPLDGWVRMEGTSTKERDDYELSLQKAAKGGKGSERDMANFRAKLIVLCAKDPVTHERMFNRDDLEWIGELPSECTSPLFDAGAELSGMTKADLTQMEDDLKNGPTASA